MRMRLPGTSAASALLGLLVLTAPAWAAGSMQIDEIVITAQKREQMLLGSPLSVSVFSGRELDRLKAFEFKDLDRLAAGVNIVGNSATFARISMRGVGLDTNSGVDQSISVFVDGIVQHRIGSVFTSLLDVKRIEVLRGPQGTLYGKNAPAGAINIITNAPDFDGSSGELEATYSSFNTRRVSAVANLPLVKDRVALRVAGLFNDTDGYIDNTVLRRDEDAIERSAVQAKLLVTPTDDIDITFLAKLASQRGGTPPTLLFDNTRHTDPFDDLATNDANRRVEDIDHLFGLTVNWKIAGQKVTSITGYQTFKESFLGDTDNTNGSISLVNGPSVQVRNNVSEELRVSNIEASFNGLWEYMFGFSYAREKAVPGRTLAKFRATRAGLNLLGFDVGVGDNETSTSIGLFTNNTLHLTGKLSLGLGMRYSWDERKADDFVDFSGFLIQPDVITMGSLTDTSISSSVKLIYQATDNLNTYISYDRASKPGGFSPGQSAAFQAAGFGKFEEENSWAVEIGAKGHTFQGLLNFTLAGFYQKYDNFQFFTFDARQASPIGGGLYASVPSGLGRAIINASGANVIGTELELAFTPSEHWFIDSKFAWQVAQFDQMVLPADFGRARYATGTFFGQGIICTAAALTNPNVSGCAGNPGKLLTDPTVIPILDASHTNIGLVPRYTVDTTIAYTNDFFNTGYKWSARVLTRWNSGRKDGISGDPLIESFATVDMFLTLGDDTENGWDVTLWGKNITNTEYFIDASSSEDLKSGTPAEPATFGITARLKFH